MGIINPIRYRGYYYDNETGLYYLLTRYYDSEIGRFISPDSADYLDPTTINGLNLYAYCGDDPVNNVDPTGHFAIISFLIGLGISTLIGAIVGATAYTISESVSYAITGEWSWSWAQFTGNVIGGAIGGAFSMIPVMGTMAVAGITEVLSTGIGMILQNEWEGTNYSVGQIIGTSVVSGLIAVGTTVISKAIKIPGLNSGRNSFSSISKQIVTKFRNGTITKISYKTFSKMLAYNLTRNIIGSFVNGGIDASYSHDKLKGGCLSW